MALAMNDRRHKVELTLWLLATVLAVVLTSSAEWRESHSARRAAPAAASAGIDR